jgi:hypothetical protein
MYIILGLNTGKGGSGINLFSYNKKTDAVNKIGPVFAGSSINTGTHIEMVYFSATDPNMIYIPQGSVLMRMNVLTKKVTPVIDISPRFGRGSFLWQAHTSSDDQVHSFTAKDSSGRSLGCGVYDESKGKHWYFSARGNFDECEIDASGQYVVIKDNIDGKDSSIIDKTEENNFVKYNPEDIAQYSVLPKETKDYYKEMLSQGKNPLLFHRVPHILFKGSLNTLKIKRMKF